VARASMWLGFVCVIAACSGPAERAGAPVRVDGRVAAVVTTSTTTPTPNPTAAAAAAARWSGDGTPAPRLRNTGDDYVAIFESLDRYRRWMQEHRPDPTLVPRVWVEGTPIAQHFHDLFAELQRNHHRWIDVDDRREVKVVSALDGVVTLLVDEHTPAVQLRDDANQVVKTIPQGPVFHWIILLARDGQDRWRIASVDRQVTNDTEVVL